MSSEERFDATVGNDILRRESPWWGVHAARYNFALSHIEGGIILDIACGTGYGLPVLQSKADSVVGVDISFEALQKAKCLIQNEKQSVLLASGLDLPFESAHFDIITSFETIEHLEKRERFVSELRRVLKPEGLLILSTPNATRTKPLNGKPNNPFHIYEYTPEELLAELKTHFAQVELIGQRLNPSFGITPFQDEQKELPKNLKTLSNLFGWKIFNKIPENLRDRLSELFWSRPFYPGEEDYLFEKSKLEESWIQVALCKGFTR